MVERDESRGQEQWNVASLMEVVNLQILSLLTTIIHTCIYGTCTVGRYSPVCTMYIHVLMRDEKEGRKKQARSNKQLGKATQYM